MGSEFSFDDYTLTEAMIDNVVVNMFTSVENPTVVSALEVYIAYDDKMHYNYLRRRDLLNHFETISKAERDPEDVRWLEEERIWFLGNAIPLITAFHLFANLSIPALNRRKLALRNFKKKDIKFSDKYVYISKEIKRNLDFLSTASELRLLCDKLRLHNDVNLSLSDINALSYLKGSEANIARVTNMIKDRQSSLNL